MVSRIIEHKGSITAIQTRINNKAVILASAHLDITWIKVIPDSLDKLMKYAEEKGLRVILGIDSNCHSQLYGPMTNKRGEALKLFNLQVENTCHTPTNESRGAKTCIDVTLTARLSVSVQDWHVSREENGSDHNTINFQGPLN